MRRLLHLTLLGGLLSLTAAAQSTLYWDVNGATAGIGTAGGNWTTVAGNWSGSSAGDVTTDVWLNDGSALAVFKPSAGSFTVSVGTGLQARGLTFDFSNSGESTVTLSGANDLTLTDPTVSLASTGLAVIEHPLVSSVGLTVAGTSSNELRLNTANPALAGVTTVSQGTLVFNHPGALGLETAGNGIVIGDGVLRFDYVSGGDFSHTLNDPITINGSGRLEIDSEYYLSRSVQLGGPVTLNADGRVIGGQVYDYGSAKIELSGAISGPGRNLVVEGDVVLTGTNTFTGRVIAGPEDYVSGEIGRVTIPTFNDDDVAGPLGAGTGLKLGEDIGEGGTDGEVNYTGATATSNRTIQIEGDSGRIGVSDSETTLTLTGVISGSGGTSSHELKKIGPGTLVLTGNNTYTGDTYVTAGTLVVGHNNALGNNVESYIELGSYETGSEDNRALLLAPGVTLSRYVEVYDDNYYGDSTIGLAGAGTATFAGHVYIRRDVDVDVGAGGTLSFTGYFDDGNGGGSITKTGAGRADFSGGVDIRGGSLNVNDGEVRLSGAVEIADDIWVNSGAVLSGTATIETGGYLFVQNGGKLSPGASPGTMEVERLYLQSGSDVHWELGALTTNVGDSDRIVITADGGDSEIYPTATLTIDLSLLGISLQPVNADRLLNDAFWQVEQTWTVVDFELPFMARDDNLAPGALDPMTVVNGTWAGGNFSTLMGANGDLLLRFTPVPEPSAVALLALGLGGLAVFRLRRRRR